MNCMNILKKPKKPFIFIHAYMSTPDLYFPNRNYQKRQHQDENIWQPLSLDGNSSYSNKRIKEDTQLDKRKNIL